MALVLTIHNSEKTICQIVDHVLMPKKRSSSRIEKQPLKVFLTKMLLNFFQNSQERTCARASFLIKLSAKTCNFIKKETLGKAFSYEFCKISNKKIPQKIPRLAASKYCILTRNEIKETSATDLEKCKR